MCTVFLMVLTRVTRFFSELKINISYLAKLLSRSKWGSPNTWFCLVGDVVEAASSLEAILSHHEGPRANIWFPPAFLHNRAGYDWAYAYIITQNSINNYVLMRLNALNFKNSPYETKLKCAFLHEIKRLSFLVTWTIWLKVVLKHFSRHRSGVPNLVSRDLPSCEVQLQPWSIAPEPLA